MKASDLSDLCLCDIPFVKKYEVSSKDYPMRNLGRRHYGMLYTVEGTEIYSFCDSVIRTVPDSVLIIPKNEKYAINFEGEKSVVLTVDFEITSHASLRPFLVKLDRGNAVKGLFLEIEKEWQRTRPESASLAKSAFYKIVSLLIRRTTTYHKSESIGRIYEATEYLHKHCLERGFKIDVLADMCGLSRRYFERLFFDVHNLSPKEYVINLKLNLAKELLPGERTSITDIAEILGFSDVYHFSKFFKHKTGLSPTEFKKTEVEKTLSEKQV